MNPFEAEAPNHPIGILVDNFVDTTTGTARPNLYVETYNGDTGEAHWIFLSNEKATQLRDWLNLTLNDLPKRGVLGIDEGEDNE